MDLQLLLDRLKETQNYLSNLKIMLATSENRYQSSLKLLTDPALCSALMEQHIIFSSRQKDSIARMEAVQIRLEDQIKELGKV